MKTAVGRCILLLLEAIREEKQTFHQQEIANKYCHQYPCALEIPYCCVKTVFSSPFLVNKINKYHKTKLIDILISIRVFITMYYNSISFTCKILKIYLKKIGHGILCELSTERSISSNINRHYSNFNLRYVLIAYREL